MDFRGLRIETWDAVDVAQLLRLRLWPDVRRPDLEAWQLGQVTILEVLLQRSNGIRRHCNSILF